MYPLYLVSWLILYYECIVKWFIQYTNLPLCDILYHNELNFLVYSKEKHLSLGIHDIGKKLNFYVYYLIPVEFQWNHSPPLLV